VRQLEEDLRRVERERDVLKKGLRRNLWVNGRRIGGLRVGFSEGWQGK